MKNLYPLLIALCLCSTVFAQTNPGDIAFTAFNADGDSDFAIATLVDLPANSIIYFTDNSPASATTLTAAEGTLSWDTGASIISAGTIITFTDVDSETNPNLGASIGSLTHVSGALNLSAGGDALFAFTGTSATEVTSWLAGIQNEAGNEGTLASTTLSAGTTFINFYTSGSPDGGYYDGNRNTETTYADYLSLLGDNANWVTETNDGELTLPISTFMFTPFISCSEPSIQASAYNTSSLGTTTATLNWTNGDGDGVLVLVKAGSAVNADPMRGITYTADSAFGSGDVIGTGNYVVQTGSDVNTLNLTGLSESTTYYVAIYEYNTIDTCYNLVELTGSFTTDCETPTDAYNFIASRGNTTVNLNWINEGCFDELLVVAKEGSAVTIDPSGDASSYNADTIFGNGTDLGTNEYVVYKGTGTTASVTALTNDTTYHFEIFARKGSLWTTSSIVANATPIMAASTGTIIITEIMKNPNAVNDADGEYFEVYNPTNTAIDMMNWVIRDVDTDSHTIASSLIVSANGFAVLGENSNPLTNGGVTIDYVYPTSYTLANTVDEIILTDGSATEIDRVEYDGGLWPNPEGASMIYIGNVLENNNDGSLWIEATIAEGIDTDLGSPGINGTDQIVTYLVFSGGSWSSTPSASTGTRTGLIKSNENETFTTDIDLENLFIEEGASLTVNSGTTLTINTLTLESVSDSYSSLISDGTITGNVIYKRFINTIGSGATGTGGNDLISLPLMPSGLTFNTFIANGTNATDIADNGTYYAFAPYNNTSIAYENFFITGTDVLEKGKGYRVATDSGQLITFSGPPETGIVNIGVNTPASGSQWNLIGNPYPSYVDASAFLNASNSALLDASAVAIYAYNGGTYTGAATTTGNFTIINNAIIDALTGENFNIAPGQAFFVASNDVGGSVEFNPTMRTLNGADDYILGRNANESNFFKLDLVGSSTYSTSIFFNTNASLGLDPGYDAAVYGTASDNYPIFSHLVEENTGRPMAIQSLSNTDLANVTIPLGVNANQGETIAFSISQSTLPSTVNVYLEDNVANTSTLLNMSDYIITPSSNLLGTGRFYLRITEGILSTIDNSLTELNIYTNKTDKEVVISGQLLEQTTAAIYDIQGRLVMTSQLETTEYSQSIDTHSLSQGIYIVQLQNTTQKKTQKIIIH
ncbi:lamin tail domain-containing protein [Winogradskyella sp. PAMC22761]|nr:lamin tail domain-containing protein [Winogradskyella sp. PAMC22761]